jgi:acid phosphatase (class A)
MIRSATSGATMRLSRAFAAIVMVTVFAAGVGARGADVSRYVQPGDIDWASILPGPPADDSEQHQAEVAQMLELQNRRTATDVIRCRGEVDLTFNAFADVLGDNFKERLLPQTAALLAQAQVDTHVILTDAKKNWHRARPQKADPRIHPCVKLETNGSYPSGHAAQGIIWATILAEIYPLQREQLMARGQEIGEDRVMGGVHYPTDVQAGQELGKAIANKLLGNNDFQVALEQAKDECQPMSH